MAQRMLFFEKNKCSIMKRRRDMFLAWFDGDRKKPTNQKIEEAHARYVAKFGRQPAVCLVNPADLVPNSAVELRPLNQISRNCFWIGYDDADEAQQPTAPAPTQPTSPAASGEQADSRSATRPKRVRATRLAASAAPVVAPTTPAKATTPPARRTRRAA
jgi:hypothetical protein